MIRLRSLARRPLTTATMIAVLAVGIGVNGALLIVGRSLATRTPTGIPHDRDLVRIRGTLVNQATGTTFGRPLRPQEVSGDANRTDVFRRVTWWTTDAVVLDVGGGTFPASTSFVSGDYFDVLGVRPVVGVALDDSRGAGRGRADLVAVIDHALWQTRFGGSADVLGRTIHVNGVVVTIVGVAPGRFRGAELTDAAHLIWMPLSARAAVTPGGDDGADDVPMRAVGLLGSGVSLSRATAAVRAGAARDAAAPPSRFTEVSADVVPLRALNENPSFIDQTAAFGTYAAMTLLILLVTGTTVGALFVGIGVTRRREVAVRLALGAGRWRVTRDLLLESVAVAVAGGVLGSFALWVLIRLAAPRLPGVDIAVDPLSLLGILGIAVVTGSLCGLSPALHATRLSVGEVLKRSAPGVSASRLRLQRRLVVGQIALSQPLLVAVGALLFLLVRDARVGSRSPVAAQVAVMDFSDGTRAPISLSRPEARRGLEGLARELRSVPGVAGAVPASGGYLLSDLHEVDPRADGGTPASLRVHGYGAAPGYFELMGIPLVRGGGFSADDRDAVIIGSDLAHRLWGSADPLGREFRHSWRGRSGDHPLTVVGVFDAKVMGPSDEGGFGGGTRVFVPLGLSDVVKGAFRMYPSGASPFRVLVRTNGPAEPMIPALSAKIHTALPKLPVRSSATLASLDHARRADRMRLIGIAGTGGALALLLASVGLYAVIALGVAERRREIGIRMAVGASKHRVTLHFFRGGLRLGLTGLILGLPLSLLALRQVGGHLALSWTLVEIAAGVAAAVLGVTSFATWVPARRATDVEPAVTLQAE